MKTELSRNEIMSLIKSVHMPHGCLTPAVLALGKWIYDMNGPKYFEWNTDLLVKLDDEGLYELYSDLKSGKLFQNTQNSDESFQPFEFPTFRRPMPNLSRKK